MTDLNQWRLNLLKQTAAKTRKARCCLETVMEFENEISWWWNYYSEWIKPLWSNRSVS